MDPPVLETAGERDIICAVGPCERGSDALRNKFLDVFCRACLFGRRNFHISKRDQRGSWLGQAHQPGLCLYRGFACGVRARAFSRPRVCTEDGPFLDADALVLGVFCGMRAASRSYESYGEEVRTIVVHAAGIDVLSICLHDLSAVRAGASPRSIRVDLRVKRSVFFRRRMGTRRTV